MWLHDGEPRGLPVFVAFRLDHAEDVIELGGDVLGREGDLASLSEHHHYHIVTQVSLSLYLKECAGSDDVHNQIDGTGTCMLHVVPAVCRPR
jgi:hypothetical protein